MIETTQSTTKTVEPTHEPPTSPASGPRNRAVSSIGAPRQVHYLLAAIHGEPEHVATASYSHGAGNSGFSITPSPNRVHSVPECGSPPAPETSRGRWSA